MPDKFEDCADCKHRHTEICDDCDVGEEFEDIEEDGLHLDEGLGRFAA